MPINCASRQGQMAAQNWTDAISASCVLCDAGVFTVALIIAVETVTAALMMVDSHTPHGCLS